MTWVIKMPKAGSWVYLDLSDPNSWVEDPRKATPFESRIAAFHYAFDNLPHVPFDVEETPTTEGAWL